MMEARRLMLCALGMIAGGVPASSVWADAFSDYTLVGSFNLPANASSYDVLADGRVVTMVGADVYMESGAGSGLFGILGSLPGADIGAGSFATAFVRVSPDGSRIAVGNNGGAAFSNSQVGIFDLVSLTGDWFNVDHFEAEWSDNDNLAVTSFGVVTSLDTTSDPLSPVTSILIDNIGGFSSGITFDSAGNLYTGNGFASAGPSNTGDIKAFPASLLSARGTGPLDFENSGTWVADVLSAFTLGFDGEGNLHVGGGDLFGGSGDNNYAGLIRQAALQSALDGFGPIDPNDASELRRFDPNPGAESSYDVNYNPVTGALLLRDDTTVYSFVVPEPATWVLMLMGFGMCGRGSRVQR